VWVAKGLYIAGFPTRAFESNDSDTKKALAMNAKYLICIACLGRQRAQLFRGKVIEIGERSHGADFARPDNSRR